MQPRTTKQNTSAAGRAEPDALDLLQADHRAVKSLFEKYETLGERAFAGKKKLADEICTALTLHATAEEEIFYPALRKSVSDASDLVDEAAVEHASAKDLIAQIEAMEPQDPLYDAKVKVLSEMIEHHVGEEEGELFPAARDSQLDLDDLGQQISRRKEELRAEGV